mmetsp:Transcript_4402/g.5391  ORF Transcript_4402/g.5391 Transcript_4402/m.5391 type:complete len:108 (+) Transcript_4402:105-428(+)
MMAKKYLLSILLAFSLVLCVSSTSITSLVKRNEASSSKVMSMETARGLRRRLKKGMKKTKTKSTKKPKKVKSTKKPKKIRRGLKEAKKVKSSKKPKKVKSTKKPKMM